MTVISVYTITVQTELNARDAFCSELPSLVNHIPKRDILLIAGDWDAFTGSVDKCSHRIRQRFGLGELCKNGNRLVSPAYLNRPVFNNTRFQHPEGICSRGTPTTAG